MLSFSFSYHKITLFEKKYVIKLITNYFNFDVQFKTSCELAGSFKIKMQMYRLLLVLTLFRSFHTVFLRINARGVYSKIGDFRGAFIRGGAFISKFQK